MKKVLYAIQGTGNGHLSRALDIIPILKKHPIALDILVSGSQAEIEIPYPVKYQFKGLSFYFGTKGGVDIWKTYFKAKTLRLHREILSLPIEDYDLIINDFEPVSAWACKIKKKACISLSHQAAVLSPNVLKPKKKDKLGHLILRKYAPTAKQYGFHFNNYEEHIFTPVIRQEVRQAVLTNKNHFTVYLPSYSDQKIIDILSKIKEVSWEVFSKHYDSKQLIENIKIQPICNKSFIESMASSQGVLCGAGFETPAEALFMKKKLLVIPMKGQYEQQCNAAALKEMGVPVLKALKNKYTSDILEWTQSQQTVRVHYPDITENIISKILQENL